MAPRVARAAYVILALFVITVIALAAVVYIGVKEANDAACFRRNQAAASRIAAQDRRLTDDLFAGFADALAHPGPDTLTKLRTDLHTYQVARAADDRERATHPLTAKC